MLAAVTIILLLSACLYWLRATIDQQKGVVLEGLAVIVPIGVHAISLLIGNPDMGLLPLGFALTASVVFVFLSLPAVAGVRLAERLALGEQPQLADMFRLTTFTGMGIFVLQQLQIDLRAMFFVSIMALAYLAGDIVGSVARPARRVSLFVLAGLALLIVEIFVRNLMLSSPNRYVAIVMELDRTILFGLLAAPWLWHRLLEGNRWMERLGYWVQILRQRNVRPNDAIYYRTLFKLWRFRPRVVYLNHGSFGAVPLLVERVQRRWQDACAREPMDILARRTEPAWREARDRLAYWLGSRPQNVALCENATVAMNEIAGWFPLAAGDEVLLTDHEYGAVKRIWQRCAGQRQATLRYVTLPLPVEDPQEMVAAIERACTSRTRLVVVSHVTSPTAIVLPVAEICQMLRERDIASCIDGPHALLQESIHLERLDCDFYAASCHKWLCAPPGSGMLYVHPKWHERVQPGRLSWGILPPGAPCHWTDEMTWVGTRDYSPYLAIPTAIDYFSRFERDLLDQRNHGLASYARRVLSETLGTEPLTPPSRQWMGWMVAVWLPSAGKHAGDHSRLQEQLWKRYAIEIPIMRFGDRYLVRVSCHLYNTAQEIDLLARALSALLR